jgi:DNA-binding transcriptional MerR regulator
VSLLDPALGSETYSIGEVVASLRPDVEVTESNLRFWEKQGLLEPQRTPGGHRVYTAADVERIKLIKSLQANRHLSLSAIRQVCNLAAEHPDDAAFFINTVLRPQCYEPGFQPLTAAELAAETGISRDTVAQLTAGGLLRPQSGDDDPTPRFDEDDRAICRMVAQWQSFGFGLDGLIVRSELIQRYLRAEWEQIIRPHFDTFVATPQPQRMRLKQMAEEFETLLFSTARRRLREELWQSGELEKLTCQSEES